MKRVVVQETTGIWRIIGACDGEPPDIIHYEDNPVLFMIAVRPRYILYKEAMPPPQGVFNEFHPSQV